MAHGASGGFLPVFLISTSVVVVVVPPGVVIFVSFLADSFSAHPISPIEHAPKMIAAAMTRFMKVLFLGLVFVEW